MKNEKIMRGDQMDNLLKPLCRVGEILNKGQIIWGLGGSQLLVFKGIVDRAGDLDILVERKDFERALELLDEICLDKKAKGTNDKFLTERCTVLTLVDTSVDLIADMKIKKDSCIYHVPFDESRIVERIEVQGVEIPLMTLEDWWIIYYMMGKDIRVKEIESEFFKESYQVNWDLFGNNLTHKLPDEILLEIERLRKKKLVR